MLGVIILLLISWIVYKFSKSKESVFLSKEWVEKNKNRVER